MDSNRHSDPTDTKASPEVARWLDSDRTALAALLARLGLEPVEVGPHEAIPGSYWDAPEAGLIGDRIFLRADTPVHSLLHEACHWVCMDPQRRAGLDTDAGGDYAEEDAVCYLQILLADEVPGIGRARMMSDMDRWGYTFRLGSALAWFSGDAEDARGWLLEHGIIDRDGRPTWAMRHS